MQNPLSQRAQARLLFLGSSPPGVRKKNVGAGARPRAG
jgi:hypothetical protein